jgi:CheY-like chemotaxis protein
MQPAHILVVDDDALNRMAVGLLLEHARYTTAYAADGEEALNVLESQSFSAVITDVDMPRMGGLELLRSVHDRLPWLPVIVVTGMATEDVREAAHACDAVAVFQKPVRRDDLLGALALGLERAAVMAIDCQHCGFSATEVQESAVPWANQRTWRT